MYSKLLLLKFKVPYMPEPKSPKNNISNSYNIKLVSVYLALQSIKAPPPTKDIE